MRRLTALLVLPFLVFAACGDDDDDSDVSSGGGGGITGGNFCDRATLVDERFNELEQTFEGDTLPTGELFDEAADALSDLADGAPDEIAGDLDTVASGIRQMADVFGDLDLSDPEAMTDPETLARLEEIGTEMESITEEVEAASTRIETYLEEECGITLDDESGDLEDDTETTLDENEE